MIGCVLQLTVCAVVEYIDETIKEAGIQKETISPESYDFSHQSTTQIYSPNEISARQASIRAKPEPIVSTGESGLTFSYTPDDGEMDHSQTIDSNNFQLVFVFTST